MSSEPDILAYRSSDREAVRRICCETADAGQPVEGFFTDRELVADLVTAYYTDFEPAHTEIIESDGQVVGYLTGAFDTRRSLFVTIWRIAPGAIGRAIMRGTFCRYETWRLLRALIVSLNGNQQRRQNIQHEFPSHVHVNIENGFRGRQLGERLVTRFMEKAATAGVPGVHAAVREDNTAAGRFFLRLGFAVVARFRLVLPRQNRYQTTHTLIYGKRL